jgi:hypothetical protein
LVFIKHLRRGADEPVVARRVVIVLAVGLVLSVLLYVVGRPKVGGDLALARSDRPGLRVLFVGNSFTFRNDLPRLVHGLASDGHPIYAVSYTAPGWRLKQAAHNRGLASLLHDVRWDVVVLQEQSELPSLPADVRVREFDPYAEELHEKITAAGARTVLFLTWGYRQGDRRKVPDDTYTAMQMRLGRGYSDVAAELRAPIAPVGLAWIEALAERPQLELWAGDGKHPSRLGSYLAACVFYAALTRKDPRGNRFTAGLREARFLQRVAWDVVVRS